MQIPILSRRGNGFRVISRGLSISRNTGRKYLSFMAVTKVDWRGPARPSRAVALYEAWIQRRTASAAPIRQLATALHREIVAIL